jgi:hypothetical protein
MPRPSGDRRAPPGTADARTRYRPNLPSRSAIRLPSGVWASCAAWLAAGANRGHCSGCSPAASTFPSAWRGATSRPPADYALRDSMSGRRCDCPMLPTQWSDMRRSRPLTFLASLAALPVPASQSSSSPAAITRRLVRGESMSSGLLHRLLREALRNLRADQARRRVDGRRRRSSRKGMKS